MSILKKLSIIFLFLILFLLGGLAYLLLTQTGIHFLLTQADRIVPGLTISNVEGDLHDLNIIDARYVMPGLDVQIGELKLSTNFSCIVHSKLCIDHLITRNVKVTVDPSQFSDNPSSIPEKQTPVENIQLPFPLFLQAIDITNLYVNVDQTVSVKLDRFVSGANWQGKMINVLPSRVEKLIVTLPESTTQEVANKDPGLSQSLGEQVKTFFNKPVLSDLEAIRLPIDISIQQLDGVAVSIIKGKAFNITSLNFSGSLVDSHLHLEKLLVHTTLGSIYLRGQAQLAKTWPLELTLNSDIYADGLKGERIKAHVKGSLLSELVLSLNSSGPQRAQINLKTQLAKKGLPLTLNVSSNYLKWPLSGAIDYQIDKLNINLTGHAENFKLGLTSSITGKQIPATTITLKGKGNTQQFEINQLLLNLLQGKLELNGLISWSKAISWRAGLAIDNIKTEKQWPEWPAQLNGNLQVKGSLYGGNWQLAIAPILIKGNIKQKLLTLSGAIKGNAAGQWDISNLLIQLGKNRADVNGSINSKIALNAIINAPTLSDILPELHGDINGSVQLRGTQKAPQLDANIIANQLHWQTLMINHVELLANITSATQIAGQTKLSITGLQQNDILYKTISLNLTGNEQQHKFTFTADGKPIVASMNLTGKFDRNKGNWQGILTKTQFKTPVGLWQLNQSSKVNYIASQKKFTMTSHCWLNANAEVCFDKPIDIGSSGNINLAVKRFDLVMLNNLQKDMVLTGIFTGSAAASWQKNDTLPKVNLQLGSNNVSIKTKVGQASLPLQFDTVTVDSTLKDQKAKLNWNIKLRNNGTFNGAIQINDPQKNRIISGGISLTQLSLKDLQPILNHNESVNGTVEGQLRLAGDLVRPRINGQLKLDNFGLGLMALPVSVKNSHVSLEFNGSRSILVGKISTANGNLDINGNASWDRTDDLRANITAKGNKIRISLSPTMKVDISPDIMVTATAKSVDLTGKVTVPWANVVIEELPPSIVTVSSDEVILDARLQPVTKQKQAIQINTDIYLEIGPDVSIDAFGLDANLTGILRVKQEQNGIELHGQVDIPKGRFKAYGQDLLIRKGLLIFAGAPSQPRLEIEAIRNPDSTENNVTAGIKVTGLAEQPKIEIFSDPAMSQEQALSYLLRGQGLDNSGNDGDMMTSMLIGLGVAGSGKLVGQIGETFGVKNLSLDTKGVGDNSQVVVSGYILPGLQVKYGMGIFDALATLTLRYRLMSNLYLEAVSGVSQTLDLLYQFEF